MLITWLIYFADMFYEYDVIEKKEFSQSLE